MVNNFPLKDYGTANALRADVEVKPGQTWIHNENFDNYINAARKQSLKNWWTGLLFNNPNEHEVSAMLFWINYFSIQTNKINSATRVYNHFNNIRLHALSNFRDMLVEMILHQTIIHLARRVKTQDEILIATVYRLLLGQYLAGPDYLQHVSKEKLKRLKKLLNEWDLISNTLTLNNRGLQKEQGTDINSLLHTNRVKIYVEELSVFIDRFFQSVPVAKHVAKKMFIWLYNKEPVSEEHEKIIDDTAQVFANNNYNIEPAIKKIISQVENRILTPAEYVFKTAREYTVLPSADSNSLANYPYYERLRLQIGRLGQDVADVPEGAGEIMYSLCEGQKIWLAPAMLSAREVYRLSLSGSVF